MESKKEYLTKDLGEAAALLTAGINLLRLQKESKFYWFVFDSTNSHEISNNYWSGQLKVVAKQYSDSLRSLKDRLFAQR